MNLSESSIFLATTSRIRNGQRQGLTVPSKLMVDYLIPRTKHLIVLDQPIKTDPDLRPIRTDYIYDESWGVATEKQYWASKHFLKLADMIACFKASEGFYSLSIMGEQLNGLIAWWNRNIRLNCMFNQFVYVPSDVSDHGWLHRFVSRRADYVWNLKELPGLNPPVREENYQPREENVFGYLGALEPRFGVDKAIRALPYVLKEVPDARMEIVGSGPQREELKKMAQGLPVKFYGFLPDDEAVKVLLGWKAGVAPYGADIPDLDSSKVRYYAWTGVPTVISSSVPRSVKLVEDFHAGWVKDPSPKGVSEGVLNLLLDGKGCRQGCRKLAEASDCTPVFDRLFSTLSL